MRLLRFFIFLFFLALTGCVSLKNAFSPYKKGDTFESLQLLSVFETDNGFSMVCDFYLPNFKDNKYVETIPTGSRFVLTEFYHWQHSSWNTGTYGGVTAIISYKSKSGKEYQFNISGYFKPNNNRQNPCEYFWQVFYEV